MNHTLPICLTLLAAGPLLAGPQTSLPNDERSDPAVTETNDAVANVCFSAADPPTTEYYQWVQENNPVPEYNLGGRWSGAQGSPRTVTWSLIPDGTNIPSAGPWDNGGSGAVSELFSRMDFLFAGQGGRATWVQRIQDCFDRWEEVTGLTFVRRTSGGNDWDDGASWNASANANRGEIRIGCRAVDGGGNVLAWANFPGSGAGGNMVLDRATGWNAVANQNREMRNTIMHEIGHAIGIQHVCPTNSTKLMEPFVFTNSEGPRQDDIRASQRHYGDPSETDNTIGDATSLGLISGTELLGRVPAPQTGSTPGNVGLYCIDNNSEQDYFSFTTTGSPSIDVTVRPRGSNYADNPECSSGSFTNSLEAKDLAFQIIDSDGFTILATGSGQAPGIAETVTDVNATGTGPFYIRVFLEGTGQAGVQSYEMDVTVDASAGPPGTPFCFGAFCPCFNDDLVAGCINSSGSGSVLTVVSGTSSVIADDILLQATVPSPNANGIFFTGPNALPPFTPTSADGLACTGGGFRYAGILDTGIGILSQTNLVADAAAGGVFITAGSTWHFQCWFRDNNGSPCGGSSNLSNAMSIDFTP